MHYNIQFARLRASVYRRRLYSLLSYIVESAEIVFLFSFVFNGHEMENRNGKLCHALDFRLSFSRLHNCVGWIDRHV